MPGHKLTRRERIEVLMQARKLVAAGDHDGARVLFALCGISLHVASEIDFN